MANKTNLKENNYYLDQETYVKRWPMLFINDANLYNLVRARLFSLIKT
jgi:hypothetical protein